jgi:hypothetical protein
LSESSSDKLGEELSPRTRRIRDPDETSGTEEDKRGKDREREREREWQREREGGKEKDRERKRDREREDVRAQALATRWTRGRHIDPRFHSLPRAATRGPAAVISSPSCISFSSSYASSSSSS